MMSNMLLALTLILAQDLAPWAGNTHPTDRAKDHAETISKGEHAYTVTQGGTMDGLSSRSPMGTYSGWSQVWESNRSVRMENVGATVVVNPWLSNGRNTYRTVHEMIETAVKSGMTEREKALAIYDQEIRYRYHWGGDNNELGDPVKIFNIYGFNTCGNDSISLAGQWTRAGLKVSPARVVGHCVSQVFYDGRWHMLDGDMQSVYYLRDGRTIAGEQDVVKDHDLIKRTHTQGIRKRAGVQSDEWQAALYTFEGDVKFSRNSAAKHTMDMTLRPGEALVWRWGHLTPAKVHGKTGIKYAHTVANGLWEYRPDFSKSHWQKGAVKVENVKATGGALTGPGTVEWVMKSPYVFVGGRIEAEGSAAFEISFDGKSWKKTEKNLDAHFQGGGPARYEYRLRCRLSGSGRVERLAIVNDLQMAPLALPEMAVGENAFTYTDATKGNRNVKITHRWVERSATRRPAAPSRALAPKDKGKSDGTQIVFRWSPAKDPDGDKIADYHFVLSDREDMAYCLSPNFRRLVSRTADRGKAQFSVPRAGLLAPGHSYFWRVRAKDSHGVWGPWSRTFRFTAAGPAVPIEVGLDPKSGILSWKSNGDGARAVVYRIYGSDEKGFTASDTSYKVYVGNQKSKLPGTFRSNFVAETKKTQMRVVGAGIELANANKAYYRVVAVDAEGRRSAASDYATAARPFIYSRPVTEAAVGKPYAARVRAIRSLGDLQARGGLNMNFWDIERPAYKIESGPAWLKLDSSSGELSGTPNTAGPAKVVVSATIDIDFRKIDERKLMWGHDAVLGTERKRIGKAIREFTINVAK